VIGIVIGHGGRAPGSHIFRDEVEELERRGHLVIATDVHMAGPEDPAEEARSFDAAVEVQRRAVDHLEERGATRIGFYGHSLGAVRGLALAARDNRVRAVVVAGMGTGVVDVVWDAINFVGVVGPARLFQHGVRDDVVPYDAARALYEAAPEPKEWREYDADHGIDGHPQARLDRYAFLERALA
jgi:pimeloyl-ACP methyl ester carboxylesterase